METPNFRDGKKSLKWVPKKGQSLDRCATLSDKYICCNVHVIKSLSNCPFECSYCFLQNYLTDGTLSAVKDLKAVLDEIREKLHDQPWRFFRIGNWELGDSLAIEKQTGQAAHLIRAFSTFQNAVLELKTKSADVDSILNIPHQGRTVVSWSLNPQDVIGKDEHKTASLENRLKAIQRVANAGYRVGLHFDPMIEYKGWREGYANLVQQVFAHAPLHSIAWISIGSLRFNPEMKRKLEQNFPRSKLTLSEMVLGDDRKLRYVKPLPN